MDPVDPLEPTREGPPVRGMRRGRVLRLRGRRAPLRDAQPRPQAPLRRDDRRTPIEPRHPLPRHARRHLQDDRSRSHLAGEAQRAPPDLLQWPHGADLKVRVRPRQPQHSLRRRRTTPHVQGRARRGVAFGRLRRDVAHGREERPREGRQRLRPRNRRLKRRPPAGGDGQRPLPKRRRRRDVGTPRMSST